MPWFCANLVLACTPMRTSVQHHHLCICVRMSLFFANWRSNNNSFFCHLRVILNVLPLYQPHTLATSLVCRSIASIVQPAPLDHKDTWKDTRRLCGNVSTRHCDFTVLAVQLSPNQHCHCCAPCRLLAPFVRALTPMTSIDTRTTLKIAC